MLACLPHELLTFGLYLIALGSPALLFIPFRRKDPHV